MRTPGRYALLGALTLSLVSPTGGCASAYQRDLVRASQGAGRTAKGGDAKELETHVLEGARGRADLQSVVDDPSWAEALRAPVAARPEGVIELGGGDVIDVVWTDDGWRFSSDPTDLYAQSTPREALRTFVRAVQNERWDVLVELAPERYRVGLAEEDLQAAWSEGPQSEALREALNRLEKGLSGPIEEDAHQAILRLDDGHVARLEREGERWVVVEF